MYVLRLQGNGLHPAGQGAQVASKDAMVLEKVSLGAPASPVSPASPTKTSGGEERHSLRCGWWFIRPDCLQRFRTAKWILFWLCWAGGVQGE